MFKANTLHSIVILRRKFVFFDRDNYLRLVHSTGQLGFKEIFEELTEVIKLTVHMCVSVCVCVCVFVSSCVCAQFQVLLFRKETYGKGVEQGSMLYRTCNWFVIASKPIFSSRKYFLERRFVQMKSTVNWCFKVLVC